MALNVKAAMLLCMAFVGGISWLVQSVAPPETVLRSPLAAAAAPADRFWQPGVDPFAAAAAPGMDRPARWSRSFAHANPLEREAEARRLAGGPPAMVAPPAGPAAALPPTALPPLVYDEASGAAGPQAVLASAEPSGARVLEGAGAAGDRAGGGVAEAAGRPPAAQPRPYRVVKGDTLMKIARREWGSSEPRLVELLVAANPKLGARRNRILVGEELLIPDKEYALAVLAGLAPAPPAGAAPPAREASGAGPSGGAAVAAVDGTGPGRWYTIQRNDSLTSIAQRYLKDGRRWREIVELNRRLDPHRIVPGVRIKLPPTLRVASR